MNEFKFACPHCNQHHEALPEMLGTVRETGTGDKFNFTVPVYKNIIIWLSVVALSISAHAANFDWEASSGVLPDQGGMIQFKNTTTNGPVLENGALNITTQNDPDEMGYEAYGTNVLMPLNLVFEAEVLVLSDSTQNPDRRSAGMWCAFSNLVGNTLWIGAGAICIDSANETIGAIAYVDTTSAFHTYRMEVEGVTSGSAVRVYQDGVLQLNGSLFVSATENSGGPLVGFGDGTTLAHGSAQYRAFRYNAAATPYNSGNGSGGSNSLIRITNTWFDASARVALAWTSGGTGAQYSVEATTSLTDAAFAPVTPTNQWPILQTIWTNLNEQSEKAFFRVRKN